MNAAQREKRRLKKLRAKQKQGNVIQMYYSAGISTPPEAPSDFAEVVQQAIASAKKLNSTFSDQQALGYVCQEWLRVNKIDESFRQPGYVGISEKMGLSKPE